jgi:hypothetical protein
MSIEELDFSEPFFTVRRLQAESEFLIGDRTIVINISEKPIGIQDQQLGFFQSVVVTNTALRGVQHAVLIERFSAHTDEQALLEDVKKTWPLAYDIRREDRLKGVSHYMSPKANLGNLNLSMYLSGSVPLKVGLHKNHTHCGDALVREVHTQVVGIGKMQQCLEENIDTLYLEEPMAPGTTHKPMFDEQGNYPWHQYETITPSIFMAIEMLSERMDEEMA